MLYGTLFSLITIAIALFALRGGWYLGFVWPATSFGLVAVAYFLGDAKIFGKQADGSRYWIATILLLPYLLFVNIVWSAQVSISREHATSTVNDSLVVSRRLRAKEVPSEISQVCDLTCEFTDPRLLRSQLRYTCHPILDAGAVSARELIATARSIPPLRNERILIHCANGHGRTGMFAAIWLIVHEYATSADDALRALQSARPAISLRARQRQVVEDAVNILANCVKQDD
jgi:protein-tyrosine phosphatase